MEALANGIGARYPGSAEEAEAASYIQDALESYGYPVTVQPFTFDDYGDDYTSANVIATKAGASPRTIVIGAHYDSGDEADGADDNASGVGALLELAMQLRGVETPYTVKLIAFGAEEAGLYGSAYYVDSLSQAELQKMIAMVNLDSLSAGDVTYVYGDGGRTSLYEWTWQAAEAADLALETRPLSDLDDDGYPCECADYDAFQAAGVPIVYFEATNWNMGDQDGYTQVDPRYGENGMIWHTVYDTIEYLDKTFPGRIEAHLNLFVTLLYRMTTEYHE
jgi:Zn-dependent M28 family amino/carboxypeptidase